MKDNSLEIFPLVDLSGEVIGSATRAECHSGSMLLHPVVHLHLFNSRGELYLQRRPAWKDIQPNRWDTAVGGHMDLGETPLEALMREAREEIGITDFEPHHLCSYAFRSAVEHEYVHVYYTIYDGQITPSEELDGGRFWSLEELKDAIGQEVLTPNFEGEFKERLCTNGEWTMMNGQ
ncbi:MAG: NUDIX domain-containing protein [Rikenellaceae bacterium]